MSRADKAAIKVQVVLAFRRFRSLNPFTRWGWDDAMTAPEGEPFRALVAQHGISKRMLSRWQTTSAGVPDERLLALFSPKATTGGRLERDFPGIGAAAGEIINKTPSVTARELVEQLKKAGFDVAAVGKRTVQRFLSTERALLGFSGRMTANRFGGRFREGA